MFTTALRQQATYWEPDAEDAYGKPSFKTPVLLKCRWEDRTELVHNKLNSEYVSKARVFFAQDMSVDGYIALGDYVTDLVASPLTLTTAHEIMLVSRIPDLRNMKTLYGVYL